MVIDATSRTVVQMPFTGNNAHSVAIDPATRQVYMPYSSAAAPAGCAAPCGGDGGVLVFQE
jgi:DNA-binding beta-propeller fold protein YncE